MSRKFRKLPTLFSFFVAGSVALVGSQGKDRIPQNPEQTVFVYSYAQVPANSLDRAEREATRIFHQAGVEIAWRDCPLPTTADRRNPACEQFIGATTLIVRIVPRFKCVPGVTNKQTLGSSVGNLATVSFQWVQDEAASGIATPSEILGPAIAHELGHLLLRQAGHSRLGIMRPRWSREDFQRSPLGTFTFTPEQALSLRAEVNKHVQEAATEAATKAATP